MSAVAPVAPLDTMAPSSPSFSKTSGDLFGKTKAFCQEEEEVVVAKEEEVEEKVGGSQNNSVFSTSSSDPPPPPFVIACDRIMREAPHSGSSSLSSSPSCDEEDEKDDGNDYSALVKRFFIDEHASFRPAGASQLDEVPSVMSQDSFETRFGSLKFELEKELQSVPTDDSFEGLVKRFKIDPFSSNMRSPHPRTRRPSMAPSPGFSSPSFGLSSLRARSRSRSLSRSRAADDHLSSSSPSSATAFALNPVLHKRVRSGRISRPSKKQHPKQQQRQQQQQSRRREKGAAPVLPGKRQFPAVRRHAKATPSSALTAAAPKGASRALFPSNPTQQQQQSKKKQQQQKKLRDSRPLSPPLIEIAPRPRKLELLQSTQRLMSLYRPTVSSVW